MTKKAALLTFVGLVAVFALSVDLAVAQYREARPGQPRRDVPAISKAGGLTCAAATVAPHPGGVYNFIDAGNSCTGTNNLSDYNNTGTGGPCNTLLYPGPEVIYRFDVATGNDLDLVLDPTGTADLAMFIVSDCPNALSCVAFQDAIGGGIPDSVSPGLNGLAPGTYWVYVDSYYSTGAVSCGNYNLTIQGEFPVELIEFEVK